jgi:sigma-B regulation protein RsbU (phosphoserine phosphatase)
MREDKPRILVVDDERLNINVLAGLLKPEYKVMAAISGELALKAATGAAPPDLILLDVMMPEMDGYEVCRRLKADPRTAEIPVIFVTAMGQQKDEELGFELGAVDYITKPVVGAVVQARVRTHVTLRRSMVALKGAYQTIELQKKRMQEELTVGHEIQMNMVPLDFPAFPARPEFSIHAALEPAHEVGGDFYDFYFVTDDWLLLCVGDVSDKGVPAALFMAVTTTMIKSRASDDIAPGAILSRVNDELSADNRSCMFVTLFVAFLNVRTGQLVYTNAGHNPPYIRRREGALEKLETRHGPVVGAVPDLEYGSSEATVGSEDLLVLFTDGVTEAKSATEGLYGESRFEALLQSFEDTASVETVVHGTVETVQSFQGRDTQADDITVLVLRFAGAAVNEVLRRLDISIKNQLPDIEVVDKKLAEFANENGLARTVGRQLRMCCDELLSNVISYAYSDSVEHEISISLVLTAEQLLVEISDDGEPFNPLESDTPDTSAPLEAREIGGLGIHLVRNLMTSVDYRREDGRNVISLARELAV